MQRKRQGDGTVNKPLLILLEIGRSPQPEMEGEFRNVLGDCCEIQTFGALDHLLDSEIAQYPPVDGADKLYTTMPDGRSILVSKHLVVEGLRSRIQELQRVDAHVCILCCSGAFPEFESSGVWLASNIVAKALGDTIRKGAKIGVFVPEQDQAEEAIAQRNQEGYEVVVVPLSPDASDDIIEAAAGRMRDLAPDVVLYDCMGYTHALQVKADAVHQKTSILAVAAAAELAKKLFGIE